VGIALSDGIKKDVVSVECSTHCQLDDDKVSLKNRNKQYQSDIVYFLVIDI
jgi:hypothetical protein